MSQYLDFAKSLAKQAGGIIKSNFSLGMVKEWKLDSTPLTATDKAVNKFFLDEIGSNFPDHAILSEEGSGNPSGDFTWVCDPIDGTVPFSHGYPAFVTVLSLTHSGESILGVIYDPILDRLVWAEKGSGAFLNGEKISVSKSSTFKNEVINLDTDYKLASLRDKLIKLGGYTTCFYGGDYAALLVACGEFVAQVYEYTNPWDGAAVKVIVEEAGGKVTDMGGQDQRYDRPLNGYIATNGLLHATLIELIRTSL